MKGFITAWVVGLAAWLGHVQVAAEAGVYLSIENVTGTVYYDLASGGKCDVNYGPGWGLVHAKNPSARENARASTYLQKNVRNAVAMNRNFVDRDLVDFCGRIVKVYKPNGEEYKLPGGDPFFVWDGCEACATEKERIDLGVDAILGLQDVGVQGGGTGCDNPLGLRVEVMNEYFWQLEPGGVVNENPGPAADPNAVYPLPTPEIWQQNGLPSEYQSMAGGAVASSVQTGASASTCAGGGQMPTSYGAGQATTSSAWAANGAYSASSTSATSAPSTSAFVYPSVPSSVSSADGGEYSEGGSWGGASNSTAQVEGTTYAPPPVVPTSSADIVAVAGSSPIAGAKVPASNQTSSSSAAAPASTLPSAPAAAANGTTNPDGSVASQFQGQNAECNAGDFMCDGLQSKICNYIQTGMPDVGWVDFVLCPTVCDVECEFVCE